MYKRKSLCYLLVVLISAIFLTACGTNNTANSETKEIPSVTAKASNTSVSKDKSECLETVSKAYISLESLTKTPEVKSESLDPTIEPQPPAETEELIIQEPQITELNATMYATRDVNVRAGDNKDTSVLGSLTTGQEVLVTGQSSSSGWYRIDYNGQAGFVSNKYLQEERTIMKSEEAPTFQHNTICQAIVDFYKNLTKAEGNYVIFEGDETHEEAGHYTAIVRYQMTEKEFQDKIESGATPSPNTYVATVTVDIATGVAEDEWDNIWNIY